MERGPGFPSSTELPFLTCGPSSFKLMHYGYAISSLNESLKPKGEQKNIEFDFQEEE